MKEAINFAGPVVKIVDSPIPEPNDDQVLIKVIVSGSNPKDWKIPDIAAAGDSSMAIVTGYGLDLAMFQAVKAGLNQGDDIAGIVEKVGSNVFEFKPGDRVAAFHEMCTPGGSYAEYAISWSHTTFHLPNHISFEAVGSYAIKLACNSNVHPIIAVAGKGSHYVESLIDRSKGDTIVDYPGHTSVWHAIDAAIVPQSAEVLRRVVAPGGQIDFILPNDFDVAPATKSVTSVGSVHNQPEFENNEELGYVFSRYISRALQNGGLSGHPFEIRPGGLEGVEEALRDLKDGRASAMKYDFRIADTPGVE
ncbi:hypothetical protein BDW75DRAFT_235434 [Aspergillus navahoensis]